MKFKIEHQIKGRVRIHICQKRMTCRQADQLEYFLSGLEGVTAVKVVERNQDAVICYNGDKLAILKGYRSFHTVLPRLRRAISRTPAVR